MLKVSFKKDDYKKVQVFNDKATVVTLTGYMSAPTKLWDNIPHEIIDWIWHHPVINAQWHDFSNQHRIIKLEFSGKSVCAEEDEFNKVLGERIAEARAKRRLYSFMSSLCIKLLNYYFAMIYEKSDGKGKLPVIRFSDSHGGIQRDCQKYKALWLWEDKHLGELLKKGRLR